MVVVVGVWLWICRCVWEGYIGRVFSEEPCER
jgi:hypothetical protein